MAMDKAEFIQRRKKRYMAQVLESFEENIEPLIVSLELPARRVPKDLPAVKSFKALVRMRLDALANDASDIFELGDMQMNGAAQHVRDHLSPVGRP